MKAFFEYFFPTFSLLEQSDLYAEKAEDIDWATNSFISFINFQKDGVIRKEIAKSSISNYYKSAKLFCIMNDINLNWPKITKGLPRGNQSAEDRIPTFEEIKKLVDIRPATEPNYVADGQNISMFANESFDRWYCDPPYSEENALRMYDSKAIKTKVFKKRC